MSLRKDLVDALEQMGDLMEFKEANRFKVLAYRNGANAIRRFRGDLETAIKDGTIKKVRGIGRGIRAVVFQLTNQGKVKEFDKHKKDVPPGVFELIKLRGLGGRRIKYLYDELGITDVESLEEACNNGKIVKVPGFGQHMQEKILAEINRIKRMTGQTHYHMALNRYYEAKEILEQLPSVISFEPVGELRRGANIVNNIEILVMAKEVNPCINEFQRVIRDIEYYKFDSDYKQLTIIRGTRYKLLITHDPDRYPKILFERSASKAFLERMGYSGDIDGVKKEKDIFKKLDFPYVIPEMREAEYFEAPENLRTESDLSFKKMKGLLHVHTHSTDGNNSLAEMSAQAAKAGFQYMGITDHSQTAFYANGLTEEDVENQIKEITELNKTADVKIIPGIESDILVDGELDYPEEFLPEFDLVISSVHSRFDMPEEEMTARMIKAVENPYTDILGHPSGRLLLSREAYNVDMKKVIDACVANDVAIEMNTNPLRMDLDWKYIYYAREKGCKIAINPDAHSEKAIYDLNYGITMCRKAGLMMDEVINYYGIRDFKKFLKRRVNRKLKF